MKPRNVLMKDSLPPENEGSASSLRRRACFLAWLLACGMSVCSGLLAQQPTEPPAAQVAQDAGTVQTSPPFLGMETTGSMEVGYRWVTGLRGNESLYRSLVNLGEGPRLLNANLNMESPIGVNRFANRIQLTASSWGGDPYNTVRLLAEKSGTYQFTFDYRKVDYFNFIPSFANPLLGQGILLGQHSFDSTRRTMDFELVLRPGAKISPFLAYSRNSGFGPGITTFTADNNEFAVRNQLRDTTDYYRGGFAFNFSRATLTLEQGWLVFKDDQRISHSGPTNLGNRRTPVLGQTVILNQLDENYHVRGRVPVTRVQVGATPWEKLTVSSKVVFSKSDVDFDYDRRTAGNFLSFDVLRAFTGELGSSLSDAERPHVLGTLSVEFKPHERVSILESLVADRYRISSNSSLARSLTGTRPLAGPADPNNTLNLDSFDSNRFAVNLQQNQIEGVVQINSRVSVRGGHRYVWSNTEIQELISGQEQAVSLHRNVALAGFGVRLPRKLDLSLDLEAGEANRVYSRTDILDYRKVRLRGRYRPSNSLSFSGALSWLDHENKAPGLGYDFENRGFTLSASVAPNEGRRFLANFDYSRSDLTSDILFIIPQLLATDRSLFIEESHFANAYFEFGLVRDIRLNLGYGVLGTTGSLPINYHQPQFGVVIPFNRRVAWTTEWRYYGYNEKGVSFQDFHNHLITAGLRFSY
ncbi:MAG: hypothetical protein AB1898_10030 [Acidobacteriota bacterium]